MFNEEIKCRLGTGDGSIDIDAIYLEVNVTIK
jgi:hypothetical protein